MQYERTGGVLITTIAGIRKRLDGGLRDDPGRVRQKRKSTRRAQEAMYRRELEEAAGVDQWDTDWKTDLNPVA
ncbi:MAG: hypothetical protein QOH31_666 [Verrucomicrobiota bacterium]|jgi:hypothetical protein